MCQSCHRRCGVGRSTVDASGGYLEDTFRAGGQVLSATPRAALASSSSDDGSDDSSHVRHAGSARFVRGRRVAVVAGAADRALLQAQDGAQRGGAGPRVDVRPAAGDLLRPRTHPHDRHPHGRRRSLRLRTRRTHEGVPGAAAAANRRARPGQVHCAAERGAGAQGARGPLRAPVLQGRVLDDRRPVLLPCQPARKPAPLEP